MTLKAMALKIVTANRLLAGDVVYLTAAGAWSEWLDDGGLAESPEDEARLLGVAERAVAERLIVGPYLMTVARRDGGIRPLGQREIIRAKGPSDRPNLGKQAKRGN